MHTGKKGMDEGSSPFVCVVSFGKRHLGQTQLFPQIPNGEKLTAWSYEIVSCRIPKMVLVWHGAHSESRARKQEPRFGWPLFTVGTVGTSAVRVRGRAPIGNG